MALPRLAAEGFRAHAAVTDPPYHLTSIVKRFGKAGSVPAKHGTDGAFARSARGFMGKEWDGGDVAFRAETWAAVKDCMLPGAHLAAFGGTRGWHRQACAIEDAGFEIRDTLAWIYGSGFPKSLNIGISLPEWHGFGTALKPAFEPIILARVPFKGTVAQNVLAHGVGGLNIDACRADGEGNKTFNREAGDRDRQNYRTGTTAGSAIPTESGRFPANVLHDGSDEVEAAFAVFGESKSSGGSGPASQKFTSKNGIYGEFAPKQRANAGGLGDTGSASRFFYTAKADAADRADSKHPTVKPTDLMRWLVKLVCPPGGTVLDPFAGTGSTGLAADQLGMNAVLIEQEAEYAADIRRKIARDAGMFAEISA